jgi:hypothetical protein
MRGPRVKTDFSDTYRKTPEEKIALKVARAKHKESLKKEE